MADASPGSSRLRGPLVAQLMQSRGVSACLGVAGAAQVALTQLHIGGMTCPFLHVTGVPCPGCGASRACAALLRGDWRLSFRMHAFGAFFIVAILLFLAAAWLPNRMRGPLIRAIERLERRSVTIVLLFALILYWAARLVYVGSAFTSLIKG